MSVTAALGFVAAGLAAGIKASGEPDLALVATDDGRPVSCAAVFTSNLAKAAPVLVSTAHLRKTGGLAAAVVLNSGNANAATGEPGRATARRACELAAEGLGCPADAVLVCSTGLIGIPLSAAPFESGVPKLVAGLSPGGGSDAARAIMTTDTRSKEVTVAADGFTVGGMAKGAAMLAPNMATMLAVLTTDALVSPADLNAALAAAVHDSFNMLTVDGATSTNDTVIVLANGRAGAADPRAIEDSLSEACADLAQQMADDAEGSTATVLITVTGAASVEDARRAARRVAESQLVQCSLFGRDPYWGRIISELGSSGAAFDADGVTVAYGPTVVCRAGVAAPHDAAALQEYMKGRRLEVTADLGLGGPRARATVTTTDLTHAYIDENKGTS